MDDRNGMIYSTREDARSAGVPEQHIRQLAAYVDAKHCGQCGKPVKVRRNTPQKQGSDGRLYRFCNKCWYRRGVGAV